MQKIRLLIVTGILSLCSVALSAEIWSCSFPNQIGLQSVNIFEREGDQFISYRTRSYFEAFEGERYLTLINVISGTDRSRVLTYIIDKAEGTAYRDSVNIGEDFGNSNNPLTEGVCRMSDPVEEAAP